MPKPIIIRLNEDLDKSLDDFLKKTKKSNLENSYKNVVFDDECKYKYDRFGEKEFFTYDDSLE